MTGDLIFVGKIVKSQGNKGEVQVVPLTDDPRRFEKLEHIYLIKGSPTPRSYKIESLRYHKRDRVILKLEGCHSINDAKALVSAYLAIEQKDLIPLPEGSYYHFQLIGLETSTVEGEYLGVLNEIIATGSNDVYVTKNKDKEYLIPAIKDVILQVDIENNKLIVKLPEGLS